MEVSIYLIPRPDDTDKSTVGTFSIVPPPDGTFIFDREYGAVNSLETVIEVLKGFGPELKAMTGMPAAIRLSLKSA